MSEKITGICFIGGDKRQAYAAAELRKKIRQDIFVSGETFSSIKGNGLIYSDNPLKAIHTSRTIVLPLPASGAETTVPFIEVIAELKKNGGTVLGGKFSPYMTDIMTEESIKFFDYYEDESFTLKNAYITAEGGIKLAMDSLEKTLRSARCAVLGFGRIGKALASMLHALGTFPSVYARRSETRTLIDEMGYISMSELTLENYDVIFNTVPERIISNDVLLELSDGKIFIELASAPGGFDPDIAAQCAHIVVDGRALPGKYAPESAGSSIADAVFKFLAEHQLFEGKESKP